MGTERNNNSFMYAANERWQCIASVLLYSESNIYFSDLYTENWTIDTNQSTKNFNLTVCHLTQNKYSLIPFNDNEIKRVLVGLTFPSNSFLFKGSISEFC